MVLSWASLGGEERRCLLRFGQARWSPGNANWWRSGALSRIGLRLWPRPVKNLCNGVRHARCALQGIDQQGSLGNKRSSASVRTAELPAGRVPLGAIALSPRKLRVGIVGAGNCASSFVQGLTYYRDAQANEPAPGLMNVELGGYHVGDIEISAAFDVNASK